MIWKIILLTKDYEINQKKVYMMHSFVKTAVVFLSKINK